MPPIIVQSKVSLQTDKIDEKAVDGLLGTSNSLAYKVHEIEKHLHNWDRRYGLAVTPDGELHRMDSISVGNTVEPFEIDAGNSAWGSWVQIVGSDDTTQKHDLHNLVFVSVETANITYFIQISHGATAAAGISAGTYSELIFTPQSANGRPASLPMLAGRSDVGEKAWARCLAKDTNTAKLGFYIGMHFYAG